MTRTGHSYEYNFRSFFTCRTSVKLATVDQMTRSIFFALCLGHGLIAQHGNLAGAEQARPLVRVGSKAFTESVILGEILEHLIVDGGGRSEHLAELGGTQICWKALVGGRNRLLRRIHRDDSAGDFGMER